MYGYLFKAISCFCFFQLGLCVGTCLQGVVGKSETFYVHEGASFTLSCVVQHCGGHWTGNWTSERLTNVTSGTVKEREKYHFTHVTLSENETQLNLAILSVSQSDTGGYKCSVIWDDGSSAEGHWMHLNVTKALPVRRNPLHRVLVCAAACLCLPVILGLARCLSSKVKPQPHPSAQGIYEVVQEDASHQPPQPLPRLPVPKKHTAPTHKAALKSQPKTELVYADISQDALRKQRATREPVQSTIYSSVRFS
ncbi:uncharacterized protein si:dkey-52l18.4 [Kryptolebias marmoratus]|uniref:Uncharacterized LOC108249706 n=1 Tax=Kryptolebias marmoratus TaxID=37003 RepID=A0A3Q2ZMV7_KRYMA|nr:uncharacterized protein si:dkey-52l18.4 [Kryptolebias marmoratus]